MTTFKVLTHNIRNKFITSYQHPLTKKRTRTQFLNKKDAINHKSEIERRFKKSHSSRPEGLTIEELLIYFVREAPNNPFSQGKERLIDFVETFGSYNIYEVTSELLKDWLDQVQTEGKLKEITMRGLKCKVDTFFNFLKEKEIISESPLLTIYYRKQVPPLKLRNLLLPDEIKALMKALKDYSPGYLYPIIKMSAETAMKSSELVELTWGQVDLKKGVITSTKKEKIQARTLKISDELVDILNIKSKGDTQNPKDRVFVTYYKDPFTCNKLRRAIAEFKEKGVVYKGEWVIADLRHSFAVNFLAKGGDIKELQRILGHGNVYDTKRLYGEAATKRISTEVEGPL